MLAAQITADDVSKFIETLVADYAPATVNRRTQLLHQAYNLAIRERRLCEKPYIRHLSESGNARSGFIYRAELDRLLTHLPPHLADVALFGYLSAWRRNEILTLTWEDVQGDTIRLRAENSKEREARSLALEGDLASVIERRRKLKHGPLVFHSGDGSAIVDFSQSVENGNPDGWNFGQAVSRSPTFWRQGHDSARALPRTWQCPSAVTKLIRCFAGTQLSAKPISGLRSFGRRNSAKPSEPSS